MKKFAFSTENLGLLSYERKSLEEGDFGAIAPYWCDYCGPIWREPDSTCTHRGRGFGSYWGPEPDEWEWVCPQCDRIATCNESDGKGGGFKLLQRYKLSINKHRMG